MRFALAATLILFVGACSNSFEEADVQKFFSDHEIGYSADFGLFADRHELVAAVFGFGDDMKVCLKFADEMNKEDPGRYSCQPLNH